MSRSLPDRPDLGQLRRQAKELRDAVRRGEAAALERFARQHRAIHEAVSLAAAQLVIARELGFSSWPTLKAAVDAGTSSRRAMSAFLTASVEGRSRQATETLRTDPRIAGRGLRAASVLGDVDVVRAMVSADPDAAVAIDEERGWPPLLYACYSRWHRLDPGRTAGLTEVVRVLLDAGASPNTNDGGRPRFRSALKGSIEVDNPAIAEVLLDAGADPDLGYVIGEAVGHRQCLQLLLSHGARVTQTWVVDAAVSAGDPVAVSLLLDTLDAGAARAATESLPGAAANASLPVVDVLLDAGADPGATDADGRSALRRAVRAGRHETAARLRAAGAADHGTDVDRFVGACLNGARQAAERILAERPGLPDQLTDGDQAVIFDAAAHTPEAVGLMLDFGFSPHLRNGLGEQPLHVAAYHGNAAAARLLIEAGAEVGARDARFDATPLAFATVGSGEQAGAPGDWAATVRLLIDAGASRKDVWISAKPPSEEVVELLRRYGIEPDSDEPADQPADDQADDQADGPDSIGTGVLADIARHLEAAHRDRDVDLLGSLLDPQVRWTAACTNRAEVLDRYRGMLAAGTVPAVLSVQVDRDAVVLELAVGGHAEGARPAPPHHLYQVFTVHDAHVVDIRGYPDRDSALARTR
jgi:ankyrin repeat protein